MQVETKEIPLSKLKLNPKNPRFIKDNKFQNLVKSLKDFPEMKELREIVVDENYEILGGNMRFRAMQEIGEKTAKVKIVSGLTEKQKQEFIIKDNQPYGSWDFDILSSDFEMTDLLEWGFEEFELAIGKEFEPVSEEEQGKLDQKNPHFIHCPHCGKRFDVNEQS